MKILRVLFLIVLILILIPRTIKAEEYGHVQFLIKDQEGEVHKFKQQIRFSSVFSVAEKALFLFDNLLDPCDQSLISAIPEDAKLIRVSFNNGCLTVDVTSDILKYGGNQREVEVIYQILSTAFSINSVERFTLLIDAEIRELPESTVVYLFSIDDYFYYAESMGY